MVTLTPEEARAILEDEVILTATVDMATVARAREIELRDARERMARAARYVRGRRYAAALRELEGLEERK